MDFAEPEAGDPCSTSAIDAGATAKRASTRMLTRFPTDMTIFLQCKLRFKCNLEAGGSPHFRETVEANFPQASDLAGLNILSQAWQRGSAKRQRSRAKLFKRVAKRIKYNSYGGKLCLSPKPEAFSTNDTLSSRS